MSPSLESQLLPSIAVIIPTFNRAHLVTDAIDSVRTQDSVRASVIVVDDGSTDGTIDALDRYRDADDVLVVRHPWNQGVTSAKNSGLDLVPHGTELVGILDSDDRLLPGALAALVEPFVRSGTSHWSQVFGWCRDAATGAPTGRMLRREGPVTYDDALSGRFSGEFWQLARVDMIGRRRFERRARGGESVIWWPLLKERPAWLVPQDVRVYDTSGADRVSHPRYDPLAASGTMWVYLAGLRAYGADMRREHPERYAEQAAEVAKWAALAGASRVARAAARSAWRAAPSLRQALIAALTLLPAPVVRTLTRVWRHRRLSGPDP